MDDTHKLRDILLDQCEAKEIRIDELIKRSGIPEQYLDAIINDVRRRLPAFPYMRPHLLRIATALNLPPELLLQKYRVEFSEKVSGAADMLPGNRFALPSGRRRYLIAVAIIAGVILLYAITRSGFFGQPRLTIDMPPAGQDPFITTSSTIILSGHSDAGDKLSINGQAVTADAGGVFTKEYQLVPEINIIEFSAQRFLGHRVTITRQVYYEEQPAVPAPKAGSKKVSGGAASSTESSSTEPVPTQ